MSNTKETNRVNRNIVINSYLPACLSKINKSVLGWTHRDAETFTATRCISSSIIGNQ